MTKKLPFPPPNINGSPYIPCWVCVMGPRGVWYNKPHAFCGTPETTRCPIAKKFIQRERDREKSHKSITGFLEGL